MHRSLVLGTGLIVAGVLPGFLTASLAPRIRGDFAFGDSTLGLAVAVFYAVCAVTSTPSGTLVDRIGPVAGMRLAGAGVAACSLAVAALAESAAALIALLAVGGVGNALAAPAVSALLQRDVPDSRHGVAFGALQSGAPLGALLAGLALPAVAIPFGWRWAYVAAAALALGTAVAAPVRDWAAPRPVRAGGRGRRELGSVHLLAVAAVLASAAGVGLVAFLVVYAIDSGLSESQAGLLLAGVSLTATISRLVLGGVADRGGHDALGAVVAMLALSAGGYLLLVVGEPAAVVAGALFVGSVGWAWPGALTLAVVRRSPEAPAWAVGLMMSGLFAGALAGPLLVGVLAERDAFATAWILLAGIALLAAVTVAASRRLQPALRRS